jgi:hypothetical protein
MHVNAPRIRHDAPLGYCEANGIPRNDKVKMHDGIQEV